MFHLIPGSLAKTTSPQEVGRATGELCRAMSKVCVYVCVCVSRHMRSQLRRSEFHAYSPQQPQTECSVQTRVWQ